LLQRTVEPQRTRSDRETFADAMATLRRWGPQRQLEARLERVLGRDCLEAVLHSSYGVHGFTPVMGVPACVRDGCLVPRFSGGGFASLSDLISEATIGGKAQRFRMSKNGVAAPAVAASQHLWGLGPLPALGANAGGTGGGTIPDRTTVGSLGQVNPTGGDTLHFVSAMPMMTVGGAILMYDYLFGVNINVATTANTVTGVPTRYQTTNAAGSWISARVSTVYGATAHNYTITYMDQDGNTAEAGSAQAARVSSAVQTTPFTAPQWTYSLNSPDVGVRKITSIALSAASTGNADFIIGHSIVTMPCPITGQVIPVDGINSAFNLIPIVDSACLAFAEYYKTATSAATSAIEDLILVSG
jgi:hypothetical protein